MWQSILRTIVSSIVGVLKSWYKEEQAEAAKWAAESRKQQLESIKAGKRQEAEWKRLARTADTASASQWNAKAGASLILIACLFFQGCIRFHVAAHRYRSVPPAVDRPHIPEEPAQLTEREQTLIDYALKLEKLYAAVRQSAIESNREAGFPTPEE